MSELSDNQIRVINQLVSAQGYGTVNYVQLSTEDRATLTRAFIRSQSEAIYPLESGESQAAIDLLNRLGVNPDQTRGPALERSVALFAATAPELLVTSPGVAGAGSIDDTATDAEVIAIEDTDLLPEDTVILPTDISMADDAALNELADAILSVAAYEDSFDADVVSSVTVERTLQSLFDDLLIRHPELSHDEIRDFVYRALCAQENDRLPDDIFPRIEKSIALAAEKHREDAPGYENILARWDHIRAQETILRSTLNDDTISPGRKKLAIAAYLRTVTGQEITIRNLERDLTPHMKREIAKAFCTNPISPSSGELNFIIDHLIEPALLRLQVQDPERTRVFRVDDIRPSDSDGHRRH